MSSNYCEEKEMSSVIREFHKNKVSEMGVPDFITNVKCPHCEKQYSLDSIRNIGLCLNVRNFGEISVEFFCHECSLLDTLYFREKIKNIKGFSDILNGVATVCSVPLLEEKMYSLRYNNVVDELFDSSSPTEN